MKRLSLFLFGFALITLCSSWGFFAHYRINHLAVFTLPKAMAGFYEANISFITEHAISADKKRYVDSTEAPRHYLNADHYGKNPFARIPRRWPDAVVKYSEDTLAKNGTVPWTIQYQYYKLVEAFKAHDTTGILTTSANLGHYVADAHVPLHMTENYDGKITGQPGMHALWESRLPELFADGFRYNVGKAHYIQNPLAEAFKISRNSFSEVDSVLRLERQLSKTFPPDKKYVTEKRGKKQVQEFSPEYCLAYQKLMHGMVERRMRAAILSVGSFWYSAWVDAGQPDLNKLIDKPLVGEELKKIRKEEALFKVGKVVVANSKN
jgi:hypothetical protein